MLAQLGRRQQGFLWQNLSTVINFHALYLDTMMKGDGLDPFVIIKILAHSWRKKVNLQIV